MNTTQNTLHVPSDRLHTRGGLRAARALARRTGLAIQHLNPNGSVTIVWVTGHKEPGPVGQMRQRTYPASRVKVEHNGQPFFLSDE